MANDKLYITISNKIGGNGSGDSNSKKKKEKDPASEFKSYLVHQSLDLIKSKTLKPIENNSIHFRPAVFSHLSRNFAPGYAITVLNTKNAKALLLNVK